jgi:FkbM family methyltransferase
MNAAIRPPQRSTRGALSPRLPFAPLTNFSKFRRIKIQMRRLHLRCGNGHPCVNLPKVAATFALGTSKPWLRLWSAQRFDRQRRTSPQFRTEPRVLAKLLEVIKVNNLSTVSAYNMGCGKEERSMTLHCPPSSGHASLRPSADVERSSLEKKEVRIVKLDDFLGSKLERLNFLKIDTEGYEDEVLSGATELIRRFHPTIYIELCTEYLASSERAIQFLLDLGYTFDREIDLQHSSNGNNFFALPPIYQRAS